MNWLRSTVAKIKKAPHLTATEFSIPVVLLAALATQRSSFLVFLASGLSCGAVGAVAAVLMKACEKRWSIDLDARDLIWDARHWTIWFLALTASSCIASLFGLLLVSLAEQFSK